MRVTQARRARVGTTAHGACTENRRACTQLTLGIWRHFMFNTVSAFLSSLPAFCKTSPCNVRLGKKRIGLLDKSDSGMRDQRPV